MNSQNRTAHRAEALLALLLTPLSGVAAGQAHGAAPRKPAQGTSGQALAPEAMRITQTEGDAETYMVRTRNGGYNNSPESALFTLHKGESHVFEAGDKQPFPLFCYNIIDIKTGSGVPGVRPGSGPCGRLSVGGRVRVRPFLYDDQQRSA